MSKRIKCYKLATRRTEYHRRKAKSPPAKASKYLFHLLEYIRNHPGIIVALYCRVSGRAQKHKGNLTTQEDFLRSELKERGIRVVDCCMEACSGWMLSDDRWALSKAVNIAKEYPNAIIVAVSANRFLRNENFTTKQPNIIPTEMEYEQLKEMTGDVPLVTYLHPDMPHNKVTSFFTKQGQKAKDNRGGRPPNKKKWPITMKDEVLELVQQGESVRQIAKQTGIPRSTVGRWRKEALKGRPGFVCERDSQNKGIKPVERITVK